MYLSRIGAKVSSRGFYVDARHKGAMVPLADAFNHKCSKVRDPVEEGDETDDDDESSDDDDDDDPALQMQMALLSKSDKMLTIKLQSCVPKGAEIFNTYGEVGNARLAEKYGFCLPPEANRWNTVELAGGAVLAEFEKRSTPLLKRRLKLITAHDDVFGPSR